MSLCQRCQSFSIKTTLFFAYYGRAVRSDYLNVLTLLCCLPVVTAGASFTAMHSVLWRMVRHEETYVARQFFDSFKRNLKQSLLPWLAFLLAAIVLVVDGMLARSMGSMRGPLMACVAFSGIGDYCDCAVLLPAAFSL